MNDLIEKMVADSGLKETGEVIEVLTATITHTVHEGQLHGAAAAIVKRGNHQMYLLLRTYDKLDIRRDETTYSPVSMSEV